LLPVEQVYSLFLAPGSKGEFVPTHLPAHHRPPFGGAFGVSGES
jgi:hypothetical protein